jgi:hypothetical protein
VADGERMNLREGVARTRQYKETSARATST